MDHSSREDRERGATRAATESQPERPLRVYLANFTRLRGEILAELLERDGVEVVGKRDDEGGEPRSREASGSIPSMISRVAEEVDRHRPNVVLVELEDEQAGSLLSGAFEDVRVILVTARGATIRCRELCPERLARTDLTHEALIDWIREPGTPRPRSEDTRRRS